MELSGLVGLVKASNIVHLCFAISFFTSGICINLVQAVLFYTLKPINKRLYRSINYYLCYSYFSQIVCLADWWSNSKLHVYIDPEVLANGSLQQNSLLLMNHTYEIDWLFGWIFCEKSLVLGNCKAYAKKAISYIPAIGWCWKFAEFIFLERSFEKDRRIIDEQLNEIFDYPDPCWLLLNAEGTRFTPGKHEACLEFARLKRMPELQHHLIPRAKGFQASLPALKAKCPKILDIQLAFRKGDAVKPTVGNLMLGRQIIGYMHVRQIDMQSVPSDDAGSAEWLQQLFREKDELQESFHKHGDFFTGSRFPRVEPVTMEPRLHTLVNTVVWAVLTLVPIVWWLMNALFSGELLYFTLGVLVLVLFHTGMRMVIGMSEISKGSTYGTQSQANNQH